jgi:hypothetical protein
MAKKFGGFIRMSESIKTKLFPDEMPELENQDFLSALSVILDNNPKPQGGDFPDVLTEFELE